jgi:hypothetical protein
VKRISPNAEPPTLPKYPESFMDKDKFDKPQKK